MINPFQYMEKLATESPNGDHFIDSHQDRAIEQNSNQIPTYLKDHIKPYGILLVLCWILFLFGFFSTFKVLVAFPLALLLTLHLIHRRLWRQTNSLTISIINAPQRIYEKKKLVIGLEIRNDDKKMVDHAILKTTFLGAFHKDRLTYLSNIKGKSVQNVQLEFQTDIGMGTYEFGSFEITYIDLLGINERSLSLNGSTKIKVMPEYIPLAGFEVKSGGLALHSGGYEISKPGHSASFLGLRDWRIGDGIRHIDWKRTAKSEELVVREFEKMIATDATLFLDFSESVHLEYGKISTLETLKDSLISIASSLLAQQIRVQVLSDPLQIPFGSGPNHLEILKERLVDLKTSGTRNLKDSLTYWLQLIPPDSAIILMFSTRRLKWQDLLEAIIILNDRRVEVTLIILDAESFAQVAEKKANIEAYGLNAKESYLDLLGTYNQKNAAGALFADLAERSYVVKYGENIASVFTAGRNF